MRISTSLSIVVLTLVAGPTREPERLAAGLFQHRLAVALAELEGVNSEASPRSRCLPPCGEAYTPMGYRLSKQVV